MSKGRMYDKDPDTSLKVRKSILGPLEGRDPKTGEVVWREKRKTIDKRGRVHRFVKAQYSEKIADKILARLWEGEFITRICEDSDFPDRNTVRNWTLAYPDFGARYKESMDIGRKVRAEESARKVLEIADKKSIGKNSAPGERLKADIHMWNAEVSDPDNYGKRTKIVGDPSAPLKIIVATGFPEPNENQRPPQLGEDGLIKKEVT